MNALNTFNFTNRATYIEFTAEWKAQHAQLILDIRAAKNEIKNNDRAGKVQWKPYGELNQKRRDIQDSLALRKAAKIEAQRQYLAEREAAVAA
jgi:hypothetical protein